MSYLIIGCGLIGSQIARLELENGERVVIFDSLPRIDALDDIFPVSQSKIVRGDVMNPYDVIRTMRDESVEYVYHTAAYPGLTIGAHRKPYDAIKINIMGLANVLEAARMIDVKRLVFASSGVLTVYCRPAKDGSQLSKEYAYPRPSTIYATTKLACENLGLNYAEWYGIDFVAVRFSAVFGPWRYVGGGGVTSMMKELIENALLGKEVEIPNRNVEYLYSKDAARGAFLACHAPRLTDKVFNIGVGRLYSAHELADAIRSVIKDVKVKVVSKEREDGLPKPVNEQPLDLTRSEQQLGYKPQYTLEEALKDYAEWYREKILKH